MSTMPDVCQQQPAYHIGDVPVMGELALAPMVGFGDAPYRRICREFGSALSWTPLNLDLAIVQLARRGRELVDISGDESPVVLQLVSNNAELLAEATEHVTALGPDILDLNVGCPAKKVVGRGRGSALMKTPDLLAQLVRAMVEHTHLPVTCKIRLGWDQNSRNHVEIAKICADQGAAAIAVHGRTRSQGYSGEADWDAIAEAVAAVDVPVLANGDVTCVADIDAIKERTSCVGVLIGRGAVGNPWIFQRRDLADVPYVERIAMMERHLLAMCDCEGEEKGVMLFRKHAVKYTRGLDGSAAIRAQVVRRKTVQEMQELLRNWRPSV